MSDMIRRVLARVAAAKKLEPGVHDVDVKAGPYGATVRFDVDDDGKFLTARMYVDRDVWGEEGFEEYEEGLLYAVKRYLGRPVTWSEGDWGRASNGMQSRGVGVK